MNFCLLCVFRGQKLCKGRNVEIRARRNVDIDLGSSVVEHLTSDAGVPGSNPTRFQQHVFIY